MSTRRILVSVVGMMGLAASSVVWADPITVTSGSIYTVDPTATSYGAVRFKDFTNTKDGNDAGNLYLQGGINADLGSGTGTDTRKRVSASPHWNAGTSQAFSFEYKPVAGATDLILATAGAIPKSASRDIDDPTASVNFISFWIHNTPLKDTVTPDTIGLTLTDLDGHLLTPSLLSVGAPGGDYNWYLTDPTLLANGFILSGWINLTTGVDPGEGDKIDIAFGHAAEAVPLPATAGVVMAFLSMAGLAGRYRTRRPALKA